MGSVTEIKGKLAELNNRLQKCNAEEEQLLQRANEARSQLEAGKKRPRIDPAKSKAELLSRLTSRGGRAGMVANAAVVLKTNQLTCMREHKAADAAKWDETIDRRRPGEVMFPSTAMEALRATDSVVFREMRAMREARDALARAARFSRAGVPMYTRPRDAPLSALLQTHLEARRPALLEALRKRRRRARNVEDTAVRDFAARQEVWAAQQPVHRSRLSALARGGRVTRDAARAMGAVAAEVRGDAYEEQIRAEMLEAERLERVSTVPQSRPPAMLLLSSDREARVFDSTPLARLSLDGTPARCRGLPPGVPCPPGCNCPRVVELAAARTRPWRDAEKMIFLDAFLKYPKDFSRIATFLRGRSVQDCVAFYYLHKHPLGFKRVLREQEMRRKNKRSWHTTAVALKGCGATLPATAFMVPRGDRRRSADGSVLGGARLGQLAPRDDVTVSSVRDRIHARVGERAALAVDAAAPPLNVLLLRMPHEAGHVVKQLEAVADAEEAAAAVAESRNGTGAGGAVGGGARAGAGSGTGNGGAGAGAHALTSQPNALSTAQAGAAPSDAAAPEMVVQLKRFAARD